MGVLPGVSCSEAYAARGPPSLREHLGAAETDAFEPAGQAPSPPEGEVVDQTAGSLQAQVKPNWKSCWTNEDRLLPPPHLRALVDLRGGASGDRRFGQRTTSRPAAATMGQRPHPRTTFRPEFRKRTFPNFSGSEPPAERMPGYVVGLRPATAEPAAPGDAGVDGSRTG